MNKDQRKEVGKWLLDIAKYVVTAVIISAIFNQMENIISILLVAMVIILLLFVAGLHYLGDNKIDKKNIKKRR